MPHLPQPSATFELGKASLIRQGNHLSFLASGGRLRRLWQLPKSWPKKASNADYSVHTIKPLDEAAVLNAATETGAVITVEEHSVNGGWARRVPLCSCRKESAFLSRLWAFPTNTL